MARTGLRITGLDIAEELLERARRKAIAAGLDIEWLQGDAASFQLDRKFRLITMPFNSLRHLCRATQIESFFLAARAHLSDGGMLIFDVPNPDLGELVLGRRAGGEFLEPDSGERVTVEWEIRYDDAQQISHRTARFSTSGGRSYVGNRLQFRCFYPQELDLLVRMGGFRIIHKFGDFTGKPFVSGSPSQIVVATVA